MKLAELFLGEIDREAPLTRRALERVPDNLPVPSIYGPTADENPFAA